MIPLRTLQSAILLLLLISTTWGEPGADFFKHRSALPKALVLRGGEAKKFGRKPKAVAAPPPSKAAEGHHAEELMSAPTAVANVLADLCPHGMLPIGT